MDDEHKAQVEALAANLQFLIALTGSTTLFREALDIVMPDKILVPREDWYDLLAYERAS